MKEVLRGLLSATFPILKRWAVDQLPTQTGGGLFPCRGPNLKYHNSLGTSLFITVVHLLTIVSKLFPYEQRRGDESLELEACFSLLSSYLFTY